MLYGEGLWDGAVPLRLAHYPPVITCFRCFLGAHESERATAAGEARRHAPTAWQRTQKPRRVRERPAGSRWLAAPGSGRQRGGWWRCWGRRGGFLRGQVVMYLAFQALMGYQGAASRPSSNAAIFWSITAIFSAYAFRITVNFSGDCFMNSLSTSNASNPCAA